MTATPDIQHIKASFGWLGTTIHPEAISTHPKTITRKLELYIGVHHLTSWQTNQKISKCFWNSPARMLVGGLAAHGPSQNPKTNQHQQMNILLLQLPIMTLIARACEINSGWGKYYRNKGTLIDTLPDTPASSCLVAQAPSRECLILLFFLSLDVTKVPSLPTAFKLLLGVSLLLSPL
jgi:hypothetical protein